MKLSVVMMMSSMLAGTVLAQDLQRVYFGTYTAPKSASEGVYTAVFNSVTGELSDPTVAAKTKSPSFLAIHPSGSYLYTVGESPESATKKSQVSAFQISKADGALKVLNQVDAGGAGPCFISLDLGGVMAMTAQYGDGTVSSHRVLADGRLSEVVTRIQHEGSGSDPVRQKGPHAHSIRISPDNRFALACDLGANKVFVYQIDADKGTLAPNGSAELPPGSGPRHIAFHPNGRFVFVNNEMQMTVTTFSYDAVKGALTRLGTVSTIPEADRSRAGLSTAETVVHPSGRFVYVSNRTHDTVAVLRCDPASGELQLIQNAPAEGEVPRNFNLDLTGKWMVVAHEKSHSAAVFSIDPETGRIAFSGHKISLGAPVCVKFLSMK